MAEEPEVDPIPWFIQSPAEHSAEVARTLAYQAIGGKEGLARAGDLTVQALPVPGGAVQVLPGAAGILNRDQGGVGQAYIGRVSKAANVSIAATGSGSGRSDLIVFRVSDPQYGGATPDNKVKGPYIFLDVVSGVNSTVTRVQDVPGHEYDSAVTLARVDLPASTGTVTEAMITNVSKVANPLSMFAARNYELSGSESSVINSTTAYPAGATWPSHAEVDSSWSSIDIPEWATRMRIVLTWSGVGIPSGTARGYVWCQVGLNTNPDRVVTQGRTWRNDREGFRAAGTVGIPESMRGTKQTFYPRATRLEGSNATAPFLDAGSGIDLLVEFYEG